MGVLDGLAPEKVFYYFEEISNIPHGSGNTKALSDYCAAFARERGLFYSQDENNNLIIIKEATPGYEGQPPFILQGHLDMVCEKESYKTFDFTKEGLQLKVEGDYVCADQTTLGGDDGIAVAYCLAVLDSDTIRHPRLEAVLTVDEEIGMLGAFSLDVSLLQGKRLLNMDSEEEGILLTSCAGGLNGRISLPVHRQAARGAVYEVSVEGLLGGHSGMEIDKERGNGILLLGRLLYALQTSVAFRILQMGGGEKDNAIPREARAVLLLEDSRKGEQLVERIREMERIFRHEFSASDSGIRISCTAQGEQECLALEKTHQERILFLLMNLPNGVQAMSREIDGLVETSLNAGIMKLEEDCFFVISNIRSNVRSRKEFFGEKLSCLATYLGGNYTVEGGYPEWEYRRDSKLRRLMVETYEAQYHEQPVITAVHAGLECGIFSQKIPGLDCISFGPNILDIHTPKERISISSVARVWEYLVAVLEAGRG